MEIRLMTEDDLDRVMEIENASFGQPWSRDNYLVSIANATTTAFVLQDEDVVAGYAVLLMSSGEGDLMTIACAPEYRRRGIGTALLKEVLHKAGEAGGERLFLEVRRSNEAALELYRVFDFKQVGIRKDYYENPREDAILMKREPVQLQNQRGEQKAPQES